MPAVSGYSQGQSHCWEKVKYGCKLGFCVGVGAGMILGGFSSLRMGLRGRELVNQVGKSMLQGGGTFGFFMGMGTLIRC